MQLTLSSPVVSPSVSQIELVSSSYTFDGDQILLQYNELASDGSLIQSKFLALTKQQVSDFLDQEHAGSTLRQSFAAAFVGALVAIYGAATITSV